jgi:hypothetical protein
VGAGATDCVGCRPGSHKAHTCGKACPRGCKRSALQALNRDLDFDHPGRRMRRNNCNKCLDKDQQLAQKDEIIVELKRERDEVQRLVAIYKECHAHDDGFCTGEEQGDDEDYEDEDEDEAELTRQIRAASPRCTVPFQPFLHRCMAHRWLCRPWQDCSPEFES